MALILGRLLAVMLANMMLLELVTVASSCVSVHPQHSDVRRPES